MKHLTITIFIILFSTFQSLKADTWLTSFEEAKKIAIASNKLMLVDFWASWCGPCKRMDRESWSKEDIKVLMANYVPVKIDIDNYKTLANTYHVRGIPYIFIMDGNGQVIYQEMSYKRKDQVIDLLKKYALSTKFLSQDLINYYKKPNFTTSFRLAIKYQDYCLYLDNNLKRDFIYVSERYFEEASDFLKKSHLKNKKVFAQKMELYDIQKQLVLKNPKKALKLLGKIDAKALDILNVKMFNFLNYTTQKLLEDEDMSNIWKTKLTDNQIEKAQLYLEIS